MFKLRKVSSHINYQPAAVLDGALKSNDICKLFSTPGHLFMQRGSLMPQVFDAFPADLKSSTLCKPFIFFLSGTSPVIHTHVLRTNWNIAFMVHEDGDVEIWKHIQGSHSWSKVHQVWICNTKDALVTKVLVLEEHKKILWLEKNPGGEDDCCHSVNVRSFSNDGESITNIGPVDVLLSNCPDVDFYEIHDRVYIWPSHTCPPGLYFVWYKNEMRDNCLKTLILGKKFEENIQETSADFKLLARKLIHVWSQVEGCSVVAKIVNEINNELLVVHSDGEVDILCEDNKISRRISLKGYQHCEKENLLVFRNRLLAVEQSRIRIFCMKSGNITQEIDLHFLSDTEVHTWSGFGPVPSVGVWSSKGLWELQMTEVDKLQDSQQLEEFGQDRLASNAVLKQLLFTEKSGDMDTTSTTELLKPEMFQNPAILLALLQQTKEGSKPDSVVDEQERLCTLFSGNKLDCDLSESMDSLLSQFKHLNTQYSQLMSFQQENEMSPPSFLYDEVLFLIQDSTVLSIDYRYSQMEVLAQHFPCKVLDILLRYLHIGRFANGQWFLHTVDEVEQEKAILYLSDVFGTSTTVTMSSATFPLFPFICKLIFIECPHILVNFIRLVQRLQNSDSVTSAFFRRSNSLQLWRKALSHLPTSHRSRRVSDAARATVDLILLSENTNCEVEALKVLIDKCLWEDALHLLHNNSGMEHHKELFVILVNSITKDKQAFKEHYASLWDCIPDSFRITDVVRIFHLHTKRFHHTQSNEVFTQTPDDLPVSSLKGQVLKMFLNESVPD